MGHWYGEGGKPRYTIIGANGKERGTTLRDAKKHGFVPSVTTIIGVQDKPGLLVWIKNQILEAAINNPFHPLEADPEDWKRQVLNTSTLVTRNAAEKGTEIHDVLENYFNTGKISKHKRLVKPVVDFLNEKFKGVEWVAEASFTHQDGFGGKVDLYGVADRGKETERRIVLDFKTKDTDDVKKMIPFDDHHMQTAAYVVGIQDTLEINSGLFDFSLWERYNLFISTNTPGLLNLTQSCDFVRDWAMFSLLCKFWQLKNNYIISNMLQLEMGHGKT